MKEERCTLTKIYSFSAAHRLHNEDFSEEKNKQVFGKCNNPMGHGHDYYLELTVKGDIEEETGMNLNIDYFTKERASGENIAKYLWKNLADKIPSPAMLSHIRLWETSENYFDYEE